MTNQELLQQLIPLTQKVNTASFSPDNNPAEWKQYQDLKQQFSTGIGDQKKADSVYANMNPLKPEDIAETIAWCVARPQHVNIQELVIYPTDQAHVGMVHREV